MTETVTMTVIVTMILGRDHDRDCHCDRERVFWGTLLVDWCWVFRYYKLTFTCLSILFDSFESIYDGSNMIRGDEVCCVIHDLAINISKSDDEIWHKDGKQADNA
jgi:hypothetical protein